MGEINSLTDSGISHNDTEATVHITDPDLREIIRIRLVTDRGFPMWDMSYAIGRLADGTQVRVIGLPYQLPKKGTVSTLIRWCKEDGVNLPSLVRGGYVNDVISKCW